MRSLPLWLVVVAVVPCSLFAGAVVLPYAFTNNTVANAAQVNGNFDALKGASDDHDTRIAALEGGSGPNTMRFLAAPTNIRLTCNGGNQLKADLNPGVPAGSTAIIANVTTNVSSRNDHATHSFGRNASHATGTYDNGPYDLNTWLNDVLLTHSGDSAGVDYYGRSHGTQIIPLKANGRFDAMTCMGYSTGTHYITIQVYGYVK